MQLRLVSQEKKNKKIAAAVYSYWADYDGEWGEIRFDFLKNETEIVKLADGDFVKSQPFAKRTIQEIRVIENDMVFSVRLISATTRFVVRGSNFRSAHSQEA